jgi:hypothetical protein
VSPKRLLWLLFVVGWVTVGFTTPGEAQHRRSVVVVGGYFGYPYYPYYASPFWYGYPWFSYGYPYGPYPYPYYGYYAYESSVRLEVTPREAEVYVDGYYAGIVDDFDGTFQRLRVERGEHELTVYRDGYRPFRQKVYLAAGSTFKVKQALEPLAPGENAEPRPTPPPPPDAGGPTEPGPPPPPRSRGNPQPPPPPPNQGSARPGDAATSGSLVIRVQPENASVVIDGEPWEGPRGQERLIVQVSEGTHHVEVRRDGYETFSTDVTVRRGETTPLNVSLRTR